MKAENEMMSVAPALDNTNGATALTDANGLADGGCGGQLSHGSRAGDWRLPNVNELHSLIDLSQNKPARPAGHPFTGVQSSGFWSSTSYAPSPSSAWALALLNGLVLNGPKSFDLYVWPVRGGQ